MNKCITGPFPAGARCLGYDLYAQTSEVSHCAVKIVHAKCDVMQSFSSPTDIFINERTRLGRCDDVELGIAYHCAFNLHVICRDSPAFMEFKPEQRLEQGDGLVLIFDRQNNFFYLLE